MTVARRIEIRGVVQGVGFRPWVYRLARRAGVKGEVRNVSAGVTIDAFGSLERLDRFCHQLQSDRPPSAKILDLHWHDLEAEAGPSPIDFTIAASAEEGERRVSIPADLATCADCLREVHDPEDRRYHYPFTTCTHCGPRFTIALGVPYDRPATTMASFVLCAPCAEEYADPSNRRFHAQPNACPDCGPQLRLLNEQGGDVESDDPITAAADALRHGRILAIKGIGGFHLACDATGSAVIRRLRQRKRREAKPFAIMVADLEAARRLAEIGPEEEHLLSGPERPIVLLRRREASDLAPEVAFGLPLLGLMLPYSPLHHLLLEATGGPLVMTSGNRSDEPIAYRNEEAIQRLSGVADGFLVHDRDIASRCEDSVARVAAGGSILIRRSRGYVPRSIELETELPEPVLACGGHFKNSFCIALGTSAYFGPHVGDLETIEAYEALAEAVERMEGFLGITPELVAHDLHPNYLSTRYAEERSGRRVAVQHHHAHMVSAATEHGLRGEVLGVIYDGTGYGTDGTAWGGEILAGSAAGYRRVASFRPLPLAGGERAIQEVWRLALAALEDAWDGEAPLDRLPLFKDLDSDRVELVRRLLRHRTETPLARGVGRYFDAVGALTLSCANAAYEGEVALRLGETTRERGAAPYPYRIETGEEPWEIDLRPAVRAITDELLAAAPADRIAARFHATLVAATVTAIAGASEAERIAEDADHRLPVVLSGGCFANPILAADLMAQLGQQRAVYLQREVPAGDGGIALGQAMVASARIVRDTQDAPSAQNAAESEV